jgi:plastocyanin
MRHRQVDCILFIRLQETLSGYCFTTAGMCLLIDFQVKGENTMSIQRRSVLNIASVTCLAILFMISVITLSARGLATEAAVAEAAAASGPLPIGFTAPTVTSVVITLTATDDVGATQRGDHNASYPNSYLVLSRDGAGNYDNNFVLFDLSALPANATVNSAELHLNVAIFGGNPLDVEVARVDSAWDETTVSWNTQPTFTVGGPVTTISDTGDMSWPVTSLVQAWQNGSLPNYGLMLRGTNSNGAAVIADSKESTYSTTLIIPPSLVINYTIPTPTGARPDLGDAPDSTNPLGITNTAYPGVAGNFPTVWAGTPITQPAGPRHANLTGEGILGDYVSRENEAYTGPDEDGVNNILDGGADNANNDRGDDGWRNRNTATFDNCTQTTLTIRVSKAPTATLHKLYLNVWFDGNHDGDWNDFGPCLPDGEQLQIPSTEWIVQDYIVDMTGIPAGGFADISINTETVLNTTPNKAHWMRFTLSEARAVQTAGGRADGRGPNPANGSYQFGETEDVLQKPQPPGDIGGLQLHKLVGANSSPVDFGSLATYKVNLRHVGGNQPVEAEIRDELPWPLFVYPTIDSSGVHYITVDHDGAVSPLQAQLKIKPPQGGDPLQEIVKWQGTLAPNAEITLTFKVQVLPLCDTGQQTQTIHNIAQARPITSSVVITANVAFNAKCPGYDANNIDIHWISHTLPITDVLEWWGYTGGSDIEPDSGTIWMRSQHSVTTTLGLIHAMTITSPYSQVVNLPGLDRITLGPGETRFEDFPFDLSRLVTDEMVLTDDLTVIQRINFCILPGENATRCPDAQLYPSLVGQGDPLTITVRPHDLGDAPDSTNHFGAAMTAYPAVQAQYPTVYDPATGLPPGPVHFHPKPFHLGPNVSREVGADIGADEDPQNNIIPPANNPDNDRFDDGINPNAWALNNCQTRVLPVRVFISPQAVNWFQQQNTPAYINIWLDANRDGDWADGFNCPPDQAAVEHIVIDRAINVVALGAGLHTINVTTGLIPWPAQFAQQPTWVRVTLSERPSNKTLNFGGINYGDGRGYLVPFHTGETEDYFAYPAGTVGGGPDLAVRVSGDIKFDVKQQPATLAATTITMPAQIRFKIDYANAGTRPANGARMTVTVPAQLQGITPTVLQAPGIPSSDITHDNGHLYFLLPYLEQDNSSVMVGWQTSRNNIGTLPYTLTARVDVTGDIDLNNNQATTTITPTQPSPIIAILIGLLTQPWGTADTTCHTTVNFSGLGEPGQTVDILLDGNPAGTALIEPDGIFYFQLQNLGSGRHHIQARYAHTGTNIAVTINSHTLPFHDGVIVDVDPSLPLDPLSLTFTDSQGHVTHPPTLGWSWGVSNPGAFLKAGETYDVGVDSCSNEANQHYTLVIDGTSNTIMVSLRDDDGDGRYTGSFTYNPIVLHGPTATSNELRLEVTTGGASQSYTMTVQPLIEGVVRDALTQQPIANASVALLGAQPNTGEAPIYTAWPEAALGQPNPQLTTLSGGYNFNTPGGLNRVDVTSAGYQAYRSWDLASDSGSIAQDIDLTPNIAGTAAYTIYVTENGFEPAVLTVQPGSIVKWVNVDLAEHTATGDVWDSGVLAAGQSYQYKLNAPGRYSYTDNGNPLEEAMIVVEGSRLYLPIVLR